MMNTLAKLTKHLQPGTVYRRSDLEQWSTSVDRHLRQLQDQGKLRKLSGGLYYYPKKTAFGESPADDRKLVQSFLKDNRFLLTTPNAYNTLGVGTTQMYNETVVYNHKRHGHFTLGERAFDFRVKHNFPSNLSSEFLLVDLVDNIDHIAEDRRHILQNVKEKAQTVNEKALLKAVRTYGGVRAKKFFREALKKDI
jgi:hypothetical protein